MPLQDIGGKKVVAAIFSRADWMDQSWVDDWLARYGYDPDDFRVESSDFAHRVLFPKMHLGTLDPASYERVFDPTQAGVSYVIASEVPALQFDDRDELAETRLLFDLSDLGVNPALIQKTHRFKALKTGTFKHTGREFTLTTTDLERIVANFKKKVYKKDLPIDYSHNDAEKAAGWVIDLDLSDDKNTLFVTAQWTLPGALALAHKEFRYFSADFYLNYIDKDSGIEYGPVLRGGALTNIPFIKEAEIVPLSKSRMENVIQLAEEEIMSDIQKLADANAEVKLLRTQLDESKAEMAKLTDAVKQVEKLSADNKALKADLDVLNVKLAEAAKVSEFEKLVSEGKACPAQKDAFLKGDMIAFAKAAKVVNLQTGGASESDGTEGGNVIQLSDEEKAACRKHGYSEAEYLRAKKGEGKEGFSLNPALHVAKGGK